MSTRTRVKDLLGRFMQATGLGQRQRGDRGVIALFHRVDDALGDNPISCTVAEFAAYCDFFRDHFEVVPLSEIVQRVRDDRALDRTLAITFDDGYWDNEAVAAPLLEERGLPACFFIATNFIGSQRVPWWDSELSIASRWMNWDQVRSLHNRGFEIGAHTLNHVDLGKVSTETAAVEIRGSKARLEEVLSQEIDLFSYPYGRRHQITETARDLVREAGFLCCLSAYGGLVNRAADPYRVRRVPISPYYRTPYQYAFDALRPD